MNRPAFFFSLAAVALCANAEANLRDTRFPSFDPAHPPPPGTPAGEVFELSQDYPQSYDQKAFLPWQSIDFRVQPREYLRAVLGYCIEGNLEVDFQVQKNKVRTWYHAPWLHDDSNPDHIGAGREFRRGMTRERHSRAFELHPKQKDQAANWAVGFYNDRGGYALGRVWRTNTPFPQPRLADFPDNSVACKLLFTAAPVDQVPYLAGSKEWVANIYPDVAPKPNQKRVDTKMHLLQVDVAVKDRRVSDQTGWVFGTFIYSAAAPAASNSPAARQFERLVPVGLSWGDDATIESRMNEDGAFINTDLTSTRLTETLVPKPGHEYTTDALMTHFGLGGRLNGPVDNPSSSCISCHGRAALRDVAPGQTEAGRSLPLTAGVQKPSQFPRDRFQELFRAIPGDSHIEKHTDGKTYVTTDYALQLSTGIRNFYEAGGNLADDHKAVPASIGKPGAAGKSPRLPVIDRGE